MGGIRSPIALGVFLAAFFIRGTARAEPGAQESPPPPAAAQPPGADQPPPAKAPGGAAAIVVPPVPLDVLTIEAPAGGAALTVPVEVEVILTVDENGQVADVEIKRSGGEFFDQAVVNGVRRLRFKPAVQGSPMAVRIPFTHRFEPTAPPSEELPPAAPVQEGGGPDAEGDKPGLETIVTARRVPEEYLKAPISISVLDSRTMARRQMTRLTDLSLQVPNLNIFPQRSSSNIGSLFIRGIGRDDDVFTFGSGVGLYLDDVYLPLAQGSLLDIYDVERVEVLRGPQGTAFGRNTIAGAIRYITRKPGRGLSSNFEIRTGNYDRLDLMAGADIPLVPDWIYSRLSFGSFNHAGYEYNQFTASRTRDQRASAGRLSFLINPDGKVSADLRADVVLDRSGTAIGALLRPQQTAMTFADLLAGRTVTFEPSGDLLSVNGNIINHGRILHWGGAAVVTWKISEHLVAKSISSFRRLESEARRDFDATSARGLDAYILQTHNQFSEDLQVNASWRWLNAVAGLNYFYEFDEQNDGTDGTARGFSIDSFYNQRTEGYSGYAQADATAFDRLTFSAGVRLTYERKRFNRMSEQHPANRATGDENLFGGAGSVPGGRPPEPLFPGTGTILTDIRDATGGWFAATPRFSLSYSPLDALALYVSAARGFRSGGFNARANEIANPRQSDPYAPEYVWTYEGGVRWAALERRLLLEGVYFYNDVTDLQLNSFDAIDRDNDGVNETFLPLFTNAGKAVTQGVELSGVLGRIHGFELAATVGYTRARFRELIERGVDVSGQRLLAHVPEWTGSLAMSYRRGLGLHGLQLEVGAGVTYLGERFLSVSNLPDLKQEAYVLLNGMVSVEAPNGWALSLGVKNATDERYLTSGLDASALGIVTGFAGDPRVWTVSLRGAL
jgi:iron complex outermembrane receptor protein